MFAMLPQTGGQPETVASRIFPGSRTLSSGVPLAAAVVQLVSMGATY